MCYSVFKKRHKQTCVSIVTVTLFVGEQSEVKRVGGGGMISFVSSTNVLRVYDQEAAAVNPAGLWLQSRGSETLRLKVYVLCKKHTFKMERFESVSPHSFWWFQVLFCFVLTLPPFSTPPSFQSPVKTFQKFQTFHQTCAGNAQNVQKLESLNWVGVIDEFLMRGKLTLA